MAAQVEIGAAMGAGAPVYAPVPFYAQLLTTTSSAQTTVGARSGDYARVTAVGADVMVAVGSNPTALASGAGMRIVTAGTSIDIGPLKDGDKIAAIDA